MFKVSDARPMVDTKAPQTYLHLHLKLKKLQVGNDEHDLVLHPSDLPRVLVGPSSLYGVAIFDAILNNSKRSMMPAGHQSDSDSTLLSLTKSAITWIWAYLAAELAQKPIVYGT